MTSILHKLRAIFLSPNSNLELRLRTFYHRLSAIRLVFSLQDRRAKRSYRKWRARQESLKPPALETHSIRPKVSFLLGYSREKSDEVQTTIHAIQNQTGQNWEALLFLNNGEDITHLSPAILQDERIKLVDGRSTNKITGDFLVFCAPGDRFSKQLLTYFYQAVNAVPSAAVYYFDCDYTPEGTSDKLPFFKPDALSPEIFLSVNYFSRGFIRKDAAAQDNYLDSRRDLLAIEYEISLRLVEQGNSFRHMPQVLVSQNELAKAEDPDNTQVILSHLTRTGRHQARSEKIGDNVRFSWRNDDPSVAIIIPTKNHPALLKNLITSIIEKTEYKNFSINLVDNDSDDEKTLAFYETFKNLPRCSIIPFQDTFNYSNAINLGVEKTGSDLVLLLNDDMEIIEPHWLSELVQWAMLPEIGVVGARLLRSNRTLQHAGIIIGLNGFAGHIYLNTPEHYNGFYGSADWYRNVMAVTGACQMVRRELFNSVGGYDTNYRLAFGDIDFCLRIQEKGYRNLYTPFTNLFHYEGRSRGYITPIEDIQRGYREMDMFLSNADPFFSPNLTYTRIPCCNLNTNRDGRVQQIEDRKKFYLLKK